MHKDLKNYTNTVEPGVNNKRKTLAKTHLLKAVDMKKVDDFLDFKIYIRLLILELKLIIFPTLPTVAMIRHQSPTAKIRGIQNSNYADADSKHIGYQRRMSIS